jgi:hypothetical protein
METRFITKIEKSFKTHDEAMDKLIRKTCTCQYYELIKYINKSGAKHHRSCPLSQS